MFDLRYQLRLNDLYDLTATNVLYYEHGATTYSDY